jgi:hypothetical protein
MGITIVVKCVYGLEKYHKDNECGYLFDLRCFLNAHGCEESVDGA